MMGHRLEYLPLFWHTGVDPAIGINEHFQVKMGLWLSDWNLAGLLKETTLKEFAAKFKLSFFFFFILIGAESYCWTNSWLNMFQSMLDL